ncbi:MAG: hypothetical protein ACKVS6_15605 [Planctomycetota bacterium]
MNTTILTICSLLPLAACAAGSAVKPQLQNAANLPVAELKEYYKNKWKGTDLFRAERGVEQVARLWSSADGDADAFLTFCKNEFIVTGPELDHTFEKLQFALERLGGYNNSAKRDLRRGVDLEIGPKLAIDERLSAFEPGAHLSDDLFSSKLAFVALLNFPAATLKECLEKGMNWPRREWAEVRLTKIFENRVSAAVQQKIGAALAEADSYISQYNIHMHRLVDDAGARHFPEGLRLITHWGLRDEIKARYSSPSGIGGQRMIQQIMERIVRQEIPAAVINNPAVEWNPYKNTVSGSASEREADVRYQKWLNVFLANRLADASDPVCPTYIQRKFEREREIPEAQVKSLFEDILNSPHAEKTAKLIESRLKRKLEPFDVWYAGFRPLSKYTEADLDQKTQQRYKNAAAFAADMPRLFKDLGFSEEKAKFLANNIVVEPSRGAGHAYGAQRRDDKAHLRTRIGSGGMDYKGYNIAIHEMGHNVEQSFSTTEIDYTLLGGVPNTAFTEALAFVFQGRDLELLGLEKPDASAEHAKAIEDFWATREIAGVALVDIAAWHWLYDHPNATASEFRAAVVQIANDTWNRWFAQFLGKRDVPILAIYSHMIDGGMYTPDYPLGHLIAFQVEEHFKSQPSLGAEFERVSKLGSITPDAWMRKATGAPLAAKPLLDATEKALRHFKK